MYFLIWFSSKEICTPYSENACRDAINTLGLQQGGNGYSFSGNFGTKGCYAYESGSFANLAFYGTGGTEDQMKQALASPKYRPIGHDCNTQGNFHYDYNSTVSTPHITFP